MSSIIKKETTLNTLKTDIEEFYDFKKYHFLTINGVAIEENSTEIQWIFKKYGSVDETIIFYTLVKDDEVIPSIDEIIPSAIISQREIVDMFGICVENSQKGLYLDEDSLQKPLSLGCSL